MSLNEDKEGVQAMRIARVSRLLLLTAVAFAGGGAFAAEVEAKKDGVEIFTDATNKSDVIGKLASGESVDAGERKGMFWAVKTKDGKAGFVSVLAVKHKAESATDLSKAIKSVTNQGRQADDNSETRARSAVMGVRGLREDDDAGNAGALRPNLRAVYAMEDHAVKKKDLESHGETVFKEIAKKSGLED